ncbi:MAG: GNAT family N-acetyltransferase [Paracoccaceae bacterium]
MWNSSHDDFAVHGAFQQSAAYAVAARACGARVDVAALRDGGQWLGRVQMMRRMGTAVALRGPVWSPDLDARSRKVALRRLARQGAALIVLPEVRVQGLGIVPLMTPRHVALWDLRPDPQQLRAGLAGKWRNALSAAERRQLRVAVAPKRHLPALIKAEAGQRGLRGYRALSGAFTAHLPTDSLRIWQWQRGGHCHAAMCFVRHGDWATYHLGHADLLARESGAHRVMLWQAALALRAEGVSTLDLGDINTEDTPGLARFKLGTGAALHQLGATALVLPG